MGRKKGIVSLEARPEALEIEPASAGDDVGAGAAARRRKIAIALAAVTAVAAAAFGVLQHRGVALLLRSPLKTAASFPPGASQQERDAKMREEMQAALGAGSPGAGDGDGAPVKVTRGGYEVVAELPHDRSHFTQGLTYHDGVLYEGTGLYGHSQVFRLNASSGDVLSETPVMGRAYFGEGLQYRDGRLYQITWKENRGFVYDADTLAALSEFDYRTTTGQGWGIADLGDGTLAVSDGSAYLHFWDAETLAEARPRVPVTLYGRHVRQINELELVGGRLLANVWYKDVLLAIDPQTGVVTRVYDFSRLWPRSKRDSGADCFNGIAVSDVEGEIFVTGKLWPKIYRVRLGDAPDADSDEPISLGYGH